MAGLLGNLIPSTTTSGEAGTFVRISKDISDGEKKSIAERKKVVAKWYARQGITVDPANVPVVALVLSGGGLTAMFSCIAVLDELKKQDLLDAAMYTVGCSGSTWALASLNDKGNWSESLPALKNELANRVAGIPFVIVPGILKTIAAAEREDYSLTDFWSYIVVASAVKELNEHTMSSWRATQESGVVPYAVCATVEKTTLESTNFTTAGYNFENTTHESGFSDQGVFVDTSRFESKFDNNKLIQKEPEPNLTFMQGMWGSAVGSIQELKSIALDMFVRMIKDPISNIAVPVLETVLPGGLLPGIDPLGNATGLLSHLQSILGSGSNEEQKKALADMSTAVAAKPDSVSKQWIDMMNKDWDSSSATDKANMVTILSVILVTELGGLVGNTVKVVLKTAKALVTWEWGTTNNFAKALSSFAGPLKDRAKIYLIDSGFGMMIPFQPALRPQRSVQLFLSCDFYPLDPFMAVTKAAEYSAKNNLLFPKVTIPNGEEFNPSEDCYIYEETGKPTVMHFPLFNKKNSDGLIKVYTVEYAFIRTLYLRGELDKLMELSASNIRNNAARIREQLKKLVTQ